MLGLRSRERRALMAALKKARRDAGLKHRHIAAALGMSTNVVSKYERGYRFMDVMEFILIARRIGIDTGPFIKAALDHPSWPPAPKTKKGSRRRT